MFWLFGSVGLHRSRHHFIRKFGVFCLFCCCSIERQRIQFQGQIIGPTIYMVACGSEVFKTISEKMKNYFDENHPNSSLMDLLEHMHKSNAYNIHLETIIDVFLFHRHVHILYRWTHHGCCVLDRLCDGYYWRLHCNHF